MVGIKRSLAICGVVFFSITPVFAFAACFPVDTTNSLVTNLVSYYPLEGNSNDYIGTNNGADTAITYNSGNGKVLEGAGFNGTNSTINLGSGSTLNIAGAVSINEWYKPIDFTNEGGIVSNYDSGGSKVQYQLKVDTSGNVKYNVNNGAQQEFSAGVTLATGTFSMLTSVYDGTNVLLYVDGVFKTTGVLSGGVPSSGFGNTHIGSAGSYNGLYSHGASDEVGIWNKALSATEITNLYNGGAGQSPTSTCGGGGGGSTTTASTSVGLFIQDYGLSLTWILGGVIALAFSAGMIKMGSATKGHFDKVNQHYS